VIAGGVVFSAGTRASVVGAWGVTAAQFAFVSWNSLGLVNRKSYSGIYQLPVCFFMD
jgi:hypothetical protein